jgi:L-ribulose-5-phosphate 3-epimerase
MKIGMSYWGFDGGLEGRRPISEAMQEAKDLGFDSIELAIASTGVLTPQTTEQECKEIVSQAKTIGIEISSLASSESWNCSPTSSDPRTRRAIIDFTKKALQIAAWLGLDAYLYVPGAVDVFFMPDGEVVPYDVCYERAHQALQELVPMAESVGVSVCIENVWNKFLLSPLEMKVFIDSFGSRFVGSYFDVGNVLLTGYPDQWIRILGSRIRRIHFKDYKISAGSADGFCNLLEGDVDFEAVRQALAGIQYSGYVTAEIIPFVSGGPEKTARAMKAIFK